VLQIILNSIDAGVYVADMKTYKLLFLNNYLKDIFGDAVGKICWQTLQSGKSGPCEFCTNETLLTKEGKPTGVIALELKNSVNNRWYDIRDRAIDWVDGRVARLEIATDITERKQAEKMVQLQLSRLNAIHSIERTVSSSLNLRVILEIMLNQITSQLGIDAAGILLLNENSLLLEHAASIGFRSNALKHTKLKLGESNAGRAATERSIITIPDLKKEPGDFMRSTLLPNEDFQSYVAVPLIAKGIVKGVLELFHRSALNTDADWLEFIETIADQAAIAIDNSSLFEGLQRSNIELKLAYDTTLEGWSRAMDMRDKETEGHTQRVTEMTLNIAREFNIKEEEIVNIRRGALLHDIGKMGIPDGILLKPGPLTDDEWVKMKHHPVYARDMLYPIDYLRPAIDIPYCHHEKWDGMGYPRGLKGEDIPLSARIFAVVDVWDALRSDRPYRPAWPKEKVIEHIRSLSGTHFDSKAVEIFLQMNT
ncbi:MAG: HD domain-containing protein, partial [Candidatus Mariimomonas ferrooxydans]